MTAPWGTILFLVMIAGLPVGVRRVLTHTSPPQGYLKLVLEGVKPKNLPVILIGGVRTANGVLTDQSTQK